MEVATQTHYRDILRSRGQCGMVRSRNERGSGDCNIPAVNTLQDRRTESVRLDSPQGNDGAGPVTARLSVCRLMPASARLTHPLLFRHDFEPRRAEDEHALFQRFRPAAPERRIARPPERIVAIHAPAVDHRTATMAENKLSASVADCDCQDRALAAFDHATGIFLDTSGSPTPAKKWV